jgi:hypothetical protein
MPRVASTLDLEESILQHVAVDRGITMSQLIATFHVGHMTAWKEFHAQLLYPYHLRRVHCLTTVDYPPWKNLFDGLFSKQLIHCFSHQ